MEIKKGYTPQYDRGAVVYKKILLLRYLGDFFFWNICLKMSFLGGALVPPWGRGNIFLGSPETLYDFEGFKNFKSILLSFLDHQFSYSRFPKPRYEFKMLNTYTLYTHRYHLIVMISLSYTPHLSVPKVNKIFLAQK